MKTLFSLLLFFGCALQLSASSFEYSTDCQNWSSKNISTMDHAFYMRTDKAMVSLVDPKKEMMASGFSSEKFGTYFNFILYVKNNFSLSLSSSGNIITNRNVDVSILESNFLERIKSVVGYETVSWMMARSPDSKVILSNLSPRITKVVGPESNLYINCYSDVGCMKVMPQKDLSKAREEFPLLMDKPLVSKFIESEYFTEGDRKMLQRACKIIQNPHYQSFAAQIAMEFSSHCKVKERKAFDWSKTSEICKSVEDKIIPQFEKLETFAR